MAASLSLLALLGVLQGQPFNVNLDAPPATAENRDPRGFFLQGRDEGANFYEAGSGRVTISAEDRVQGPTATYGDQAQVRVEFRLGNDEWVVTLDRPGFPPPRVGGPGIGAPWSVDGGVLTNAWVNGVTGIGSRLAPSSLAAIAVFGVGRVEVNGQLITDRAVIEALALAWGYHSDDPDNHRALNEARRGDAEIVVRVTRLPQETLGRSALEFSFDEVVYEIGEARVAEMTTVPAGVEQDAAAAPSGVPIGGGAPVGGQGVAFGLPTATGPVIVATPGVPTAGAPAPGTGGAGPTVTTPAEPLPRPSTGLQARTDLPVANAPPAGPETTAALTDVPPAGTQRTADVVPPSPFGGVGFAGLPPPPGTPVAAAGGGTQLGATPGVTSSPANPELAGRTGAIAPSLPAGAFATAPIPPGTAPTPATQGAQTTGGQPTAPTATGTPAAAGTTPGAAAPTAPIPATADAVTPTGQTALIGPDGRPIAGTVTVPTAGTPTVPTQPTLTGAPSVTGFTFVTTGIPGVTGAPSVTGFGTPAAGGALTPTTPGVGTAGNVTPSGATTPVPGTVGAVGAPTPSGFFSPGLPGTPQPLNSQPAAPLPLAERPLNAVPSISGTPLPATPAPLNSAPAGALPATPTPLTATPPASPPGLGTPSTVAPSTPAPGTPGTGGTAGGTATGTR